MVLAVMAKYFPAPNLISDYCNNVNEFNRVTTVEDNSIIPLELSNSLKKSGRIPIAGNVKYIFFTKAGPGPIKQEESECLLNPNTGLPVEPGIKHKRMIIHSGLPPTPP